MLYSTLLLRPALSRLQVKAPRVRSVGGGITVLALSIFVSGLVVPAAPAQPAAPPPANEDLAFSRVLDGVEPGGNPSGDAPESDDTLSADFVIERFDHASGEWVPVNLHRPVELGVRLRFRLLYNGPTGYVCWYFWDGTYGSAPEEYRQCASPGLKTVSVRVDSPDRTKRYRQGLTFGVSTGTTLLSASPYAGCTFLPALHAFQGTDVWMVSAEGRVGVINIANPYALPAVQVFPGSLLTGLSAATLDNGKFYVSRGTAGTNVYRASRDQFALLGTLTPAQVGAQKTSGIAAAGDVLYVGAVTPHKLLAYDMSNPAAPVLLASLPLSVRPECVAQINNEALVVYQLGATSFLLFDIRQPGLPQPVPRTTTPLTYAWPTGGPTLERGVITNGRQFAIRGGVQSVFSEVVVGETLSVADSHLMPLAPASTDFTHGRSFTRQGRLISKCAFGEPGLGEPYWMETFDTQESYDSVPMFVRDVDGDGPLPPVLFVSVTCGFNAYKTLP